MNKLSNELLDEVISNLTEDVRDLKKHDKNDMLTTATSWLIFLEELKEYRQLEEQGLLHKASLPNGTPIYYWQQNEDDEWFVFKDSYLHGVTEFFQGKYEKDFFATEEECRNHFVS